MENFDFVSCSGVMAWQINGNFSPFCTRCGLFGASTMECLCRTKHYDWKWSTLNLGRFFQRQIILLLLTLGILQTIMLPMIMECWDASYVLLAQFSKRETSSEFDKLAWLPFSSEGKLHFNSQYEGLWWSLTGKFGGCWWNKGIGLGVCQDHATCFWGCIFGGIQSSNHHWTWY